MLYIKQIYKHKLFPILMGWRSLCIMIFVQFINLNVFAAGYTLNKLNDAQEYGQEIFVNGDAYIVGLEHNSKIKIIYSESKHVIKKAEISSHVALAKNKQLKKVEEQYKKSAVEKIINNRPDRSTLFSTSNAGITGFSLPSDHFQALRFVPAIKMRLLVFRGLKTKILYFVIFFHRHFQKFCFGRPPPIHLISP